MSTKREILRVLKEYTDGFGLLACEIYPKLPDIQLSTIRGCLVLLERGGFINAVKNLSQTPTGRWARVYYINQKGEDEIRKLSCE